MISPLLANIYLHYAFDLWANRWRQREATGDMIIVRYADDIVAGPGSGLRPARGHASCTRPEPAPAKAGAHRFLDMMRARLEEFALALHPEKTRLIQFGRHAAADREERGLGKPETPSFNFLGFTFISGKDRRGNFQLKRKTRRDRMKAKLLEVKEELRRRMHRPIPEQGKWLKRVVSGFFNYHAVPTNSRALAIFRHRVTVLWQRTLRRRSQKDRTSWDRMAGWWTTGSPNRVSFIHGQACALPSDTRGGSRMRESRMYGSVRGAPSNGRPYRDPGLGRP